MLLKENEKLTFKLINNYLKTIDRRERGSAKVVVEVSPEIFNELCSEQTANRVFHEGFMTELGKESKEINLSSVIPCTISKKYTLPENQARFKVTRYVNEYSEVEFEELT